MEIERDVVIEPERNREFAHTTVPTPAPAMPNFSEDEVNQDAGDDWRQRITDLVRQVEANIREAQRATREKQLLRRRLEG